ncbi:MAG: hypothetical protein J6V41_05205 [Kiritimatiellae bacterium]|nr:hypothetical protein [Kiritimatiellia bacterium]
MAKEKKLEKKEKNCYLKSILRLICKGVLSVFAYFWAIGIIRTFIQYTDSDDGIMGVPEPFFYFICTFSIGTILIAFFENRFSRHYLYCHELTHAIFAILTGSKISNLKIHKTSASIKVSKPNLIVVLAPYIISLHILFFLFLYGCFSVAFPNCSNIYHNFFTILIGFSASFHFLFTVKSLLQKQTDFERSGFFFSYLLITTLNLAGAMTIFTCIDKISFNYFIRSSLSHTFDTITKIWINIINII